MSVPYYIQVDGNIHGPFTREQIDHGFAAGRIPPHANYAHAAHGPWAPFSRPETIAELQNAVSAPHAKTIPRKSQTDYSIVPGIIAVCAFLNMLGIAFYLANNATGDKRILIMLAGFGDACIAAWFWFHLCRAIRRASGD